MWNSLEGNITKYNMLRVFNKRVFLPLISIYLVAVGNITLVQLAVISSITALVQIVLEVPTGYLADRWGHKNSIVFGNLIMACSVLPYIFYPNFLGGLTASILYFGGYSFCSGAMQAFLHETLLSLGKGKDYARVMGKSQSYGLLGNMVLIALVPLTYSIDKRLPFILGFVCLFISFLVAVSLKLPPKREFIHEQHNLKKEFSFIFKSSGVVALLAFFMLFGISSAGLDQTSVYRELVFKSVGVPIFYYGFILSVGSLLAAVMGRYIHKLAEWPAKRFLVFDILYLCLALVLVGISKNPAVIIFAFTLFPVYSRNRDIVFESRLFAEFPTIKHKSTLISTLQFFPILSNLWVPFLLTYWIGAFNFTVGYLFYGLSLLCILFSVFFVYKFAKRN